MKRPELPFHVKIPNWIRHPLWWMPDIPAEQNRSFDRIWQAFGQITRLEDGRHDVTLWTKRTGDLVLCCVRVPLDAFTPEFQAVRQGLTGIPGVRLLPPEVIHIAIQELGFVTDQPTRRDEFTWVRLEEFLSYVERPIGDFNPFAIGLGGINSFADAAFIDVHDNGWLSRIHFRMRDFVIVPPNKHFPYLPCAMIAHYTGTGSAIEMIDRLTPFRNTQLGSFLVTEIDVVRLRIDEPYPPMEIERTIRLGMHRIEAPVRPLTIEPLDDRV